MATKCHRHSGVRRNNRNIGLGNFSLPLCLVASTNHTQDGNVKEELIYSSPRRTPGSSLLIPLDSGVRRDDDSGFIQ
jgi:hypothetical protein